jgi:pyruvate formate-lyase/glycerol dehydratase family glycyl radical enzyme
MRVIMSIRTEKLRKKLVLVKPEICSERALIFTRSMQKTEGEPISIRRAKAFYDVLDQMSIYIQKGELIVGNQASKPKASPIYPEYSINWLREEFEGNPFYFFKRPGDKFFYTDKVKDEILSVTNYWEGKTVYENLRKNLPANCNEAWNAGIIDDTWVSSSGFGNLLVDYEKVLKIGLKGIIEQAEERKIRLKLTEPDEIKKSWFLDSVIISSKAVINFSKRFAAEAKKQAIQEQNPERKLELETIAEICRNVPAQGAENYWEAVQSIWMILLALHLEANGHAISLGRIDQFLYPFYQNDIEKGVLTRGKALELMELLYIKTNELNKLRSWPDTSFFLGYQMFVNLAVGGQTIDGMDAINEISYICVEACENLKLFTPSVSVKVYTGSDPEFIKRSLKAVQIHKGGQPAFYNDDRFMEMLDNMGVKKSDQYNWAPVGCIEAGIHGKWDYAAKGTWLSIAKVLELTLNGGMDPATGKTFLAAKKNLLTFENIDEVFEEFKRQLHYFMELQVITEHINDEMHKQIDINAFRSSLVDDCIERGLSLLEGGSVYSADGGPTAGQVSSGNSLAALETVVFRDKILTKEQVFHSLKTNFEDETTTPTGEQIRNILINKAPKYGNDNDESDKWSVAITEYLGSTYSSEFHNSRYGKGPIPGTYGFGQSPVTGNIAFGGFIGALPNGKKAGKPVNNGISPDNGTEISGITAAMNSVAKMPSIWFQKGAIFNARLSEDTLLEKKGVDRISSLIFAFFKKKGIQVQFNVVSSETLQKAQMNPEEYGDLMVRVSGYSALFTPLDPAVQEDIIERAEFEV